MTEPRSDIVAPPLPDRQELQAVRAAWEAFMAGEDVARQHVRPAIWASWQRCQQLKIDPCLHKLPLTMSAEDCEAEQEREDLLHVALPLFDTILKAWEQEHFLIGLSNRYGHILHVTGRSELLDQAQAINVVPGGKMAEEDIGTAVANVVLSHGQPDYVLWSEHYCQAFHDWAAVGAPLFHPLTRELIGVLGAAGTEIPHPWALGLVQHFAKRIEQLLCHEELIRRTRLLDAYHHFVLQHPHDIVLALDVRGHVCGASPSLSQLLDMPQQVLEQSILHLPGLHVEDFQLARLQNGPQTYEVHVNTPTTERSLKAEATPISGERQSVGTLLVLPPVPASRQSQARSAASGWTARYTFTDLVGAAVPFQECVAQARQAATGHYPVLLLGESGTGKELFAQAIHTASPRRKGPFVTVNCGAASDDLLAAELFGYVEGAFTGAVKGGKKGVLELAHGGTLLLDEVEAMPPKMQVSLLRVLEDGKLARVGAERLVPIDVRLIAASNEDLHTAVQDKRFRPDLYYRLCVFPIELPELRQRTEDLPLLVRFLLKQLGHPQIRLTAEALAILKQYAWPGNIRELKHVLLRAVHATEGMRITPAALPPEVVGEARDRETKPSSLWDTERKLIRQALAGANGNVGQAAAQLGIHRATLYRKLKRFGLAAAGEPTALSGGERSGTPHRG